MAKAAGEKTKRNKKTRMRIGESIISLMHEIPYDEIKISEVSKQADVSRMTFYQYYSTKEEALKRLIFEKPNQQSGNRIFLSKYERSYS